MTKYTHLYDGTNIFFITGYNFETEFVSTKNTDVFYFVHAVMPVA